jgi:hypothetical protein
LVRGGEAMFLEAESAPALGADVRSVYTERRYDLKAGDRLFLYSDGLIEKRGENLEVSLERLRDIAMTIATDIPLEASCDLIISELWADSSGDDVMLVALEPQLARCGQPVTRRCDRSERVSAGGRPMRSFSQRSRFEGDPWLRSTWTARAAFSSSR